jgi:hypothetical protein
MANKKKYQKAAISPKGFSKESEKLAQEIRGESIMLVLGYSKWLEWSDIEPDTLVFVQKFWTEGNELMDTLAAGGIWEARNLLEKGPWGYQDLGMLIRDLDQWAMALSEERREIGDMPLEEVSKTVYYGLETYHEALLAKHAESAQAAETLQQALEGLGLELWDSGAMYDRDGNQDGPRDLVMGMPETEIEYAFRIYHSPRRAEYEGTLPEDLAAAVRQWQAAT